MNELLDWKAAAERLGVPENWLRNQTRMGTGPTYIKPSARTILFRDEDLDRWRASWKIIAGK